MAAIGHDGWWIDDVHVSDTLMQPAAVAIDTAVNATLPTHPDTDGDGLFDVCDLCPSDSSSPQSDLDFDGFANVCDCDVDAPQTYPGAPEVFDGLDNQCNAGEPGFGLVDEIPTLARFDSPTRFEWAPMLGVTTYQVIRAFDKRLVGGCSCNPTADPWLDDPAVPPPGFSFYYVAQVLEPTAGSAGADSDGNERFGRCVVDICAP